ncbi:F-box/FBD/LRR-repeat protein At1g13570-like isoform X2 [Tasmannia lanceolata]
MRAKSKLSRKIQTRKGDDRISYLSDDILIMILTRIPLREAVRTSVLSKRWTYLWRSIPYLELSTNLIREPDEACNYWDDMEKWVYTVHHILDSRLAPVLSCKIHYQYIVKFRDYLEEFVLFLCGNGIQDLYLRSMVYYKFPTDAYSCQSLKKLTLFRCKVVLPPLFEGISCLTALTFIHVSITDDDLERFISSCRLLESFCLDDDWVTKSELRNLRINALILLSLEIQSSMPTNISFIHVPRLKNIYYRPNLFFDDNDANVFLELLMNLGHVESLTLELKSYFTEQLCRMKMPKSLPAFKLKKLTLKVDFDVANFLSCLIRSCRNLQELNIIITKGIIQENVEENFWERQGPSEGLMYHLTTVWINMDYRISCYGIGFMEFLLKNAYSLKRMSINYCKSLKKQLEAEISELSLLQRASPHAVLEFKTIVRRDL